MEERRLPLLPKEEVLASYRGDGGTLHATNRRLLFFQRRFRTESYGDLNYGEVTSVTLESQGRRAAALVWAGLSFLATAVLWTLPGMFASGQTDGAIAPDVVRGGASVLAFIVAAFGIWRLVGFFRVHQTYTLEGPGLLRDARHAARWQFSVRNSREAASFISTVRDQALQREEALQRLLRMADGLPSTPAAEEIVPATQEEGESGEPQTFLAIEENQATAVKEEPKPMETAPTTPKTMFEKIWETHVVHEEPGHPSLLYVDLHLVHEVTSPQAFEGLRMTGRSVRRPELSVATVDHNVPTTDRSLPIADETSRRQIEALEENCREFGITLHDIHSQSQGIVHVIGPEQGYTQPGLVIACGDSHTSTHGAFGAFAMPIGTSQVEHVLATQCLVQAKPKAMEIRVNGALPPGVTAKDLILGIIGQIGVSGATGYVVEYTGQAIRSLSMGGRMTVCNMTIEAGARVGMIAPDETTFDWLRGRPQAPQGAAFDKAVERWRDLATDAEATFDKVVEIDATKLAPYVTWGTNPGMVVAVTGRVPDPASFDSPADRTAAAQALEYMGLEPNTLVQEIAIDRVFIGSCTNSRLEDLRAAAAVVQGRKVHSDVNAMVVPGSFMVKMQAQAEGLDRIFREAGFEWREAGCSMCLGMNPDVLQPRERCASTSNRNFEGRQGPEGRTHLVSPQMAAAAAIAGHFVDVREW